MTTQARTRRTPSAASPHAASDVFVRRAKQLDGVATKTTIVATSLGLMSIATDATGRIVSLGLAPKGARTSQEVPRECAGAAEQLDEYLAGTRQTFDLNLEPKGTPFQHAVWKQLKTIPFGVIRTYAEVARAIGRPTATRAVGAACGRNPIGIVVPCHRVVGSSGTLTGYYWGTELKRRLLELEGVAVVDGRVKPG
ncbi:MAG: methylated-DNA--[protein]-cysteine S-methyltransferase [Planctomycetota bacterium]|nr:methylated-DNA--[protein]-cysteine S-methyltransferase [Planctomycetota bacterium]